MDFIAIYIGKCNEKMVDYSGQEIERLQRKISDSSLAVAVVVAAVVGGGGCTAIANVC